MFKDFYESWWFLWSHPMFEDEYEEGQFELCTDIYVAKVNPENNTIEDDESLNTKTQVWLETGNYDANVRVHDINLDCGGDTYEEAIIELANLVYDEYGNEYN